MEQHFTIAIPAYNCENWVKKNLNSALSQNYENFEVIYIDDASTENTGIIANKLLSESKINHRLFQNKQNKRALFNLVSAIDSARDNTIILALDGDDWLPNKNILSRLNKIYSDTNVWITAGSYIDNVHHAVSRPVITENFWTDNLRRMQWTLSHLRTFRKKLFNKIKKEDMIDVDGEYYKFTWDRVIMYPMVEMSGPEHFKPINEIMYVYNRANPISVDRVHRSEQLRIESVLRNKKPYGRIEKL